MSPRFPVYSTDYGGDDKHVTLDHEYRCALCQQVRDFRSGGMAPVRAGSSKSKDGGSVRTAGERGTNMKTNGSFKMPLSSAERMRLYRKRRRQGLQYVRVELHATDIDDLIRLGLLKGDQRENPELLQSAVQGLIYRRLEDPT